MLANPFSKVGPFFLLIQERDWLGRKPAYMDGGWEGVFRLTVSTSSQGMRIHLNICCTSDFLCKLLTFTHPCIPQTFAKWCCDDEMRFTR